MIFVSLIAVTAIFLLLCGGAALYLMMGIGQLVTGYKEKDFSKKRQGWITAVIALAVIGVCTYYYLRLFTFPSLFD